MQSSRANPSSNISWIRPEYIDFNPASGHINFVKHLYPRSESGSEWNAGSNLNPYSEIPELKKRLAMFASGIQTLKANIDNAAIVLPVASNADSAYMRELINKAARCQLKTNLLVIGNLSSPISLLVDVSCYRFLYMHMSDYYN
jgi:hypothetical protein